MSLGRFDEQNLAEFRELASVKYDERGYDEYIIRNMALALANYKEGDSEEYVIENLRRLGRDAAQALGDVGRSYRDNIIDPARRAAGNTLIRAGQAIRPTPTPPMRTIAPQLSVGVATGAGGLGTPAVQAVGQRASSSGGGNRTSSSGGGNRTSSSGGGNRTSSSGGGNRQPVESAAQREARLQREREEAERRERERREAEERIQKQREETEAARKERLRSITRDVAQRILENALVNANRGQSDTDSQLCQRPDGSVYGIAKGQNCVSGKPIDSRPEPDRTEQINEAARNDPNQQNLPVGWRTTRPDTPAPSEAGGSGSSSRTPEEARRRARERSQAQGRERALEMGREYQRSPRGTATPPPAPAPVPAAATPSSADSRISGNVSEASA